MPRLPFTLSGLVAQMFTATLAGCMASPAFGGGCLSDITNNQVTNVDDLLAVINDWGPCSGNCVADATNNGVVNVDDLLLVINGWGPCQCLPSLGCLDAYTVWCDDFNLNNYSRWTGGYGADSSCETTGFSTTQSITAPRSHKSTVVCATSQSHRGYGGLRFQGDVMTPSFSIPSTGGIDAPHGVIVTFHSWIQVPYLFSPSKWLSLFTVTHDCSNNWADVITLNLDDSSMKIKPVHVASVSYSPGAPSMPLQQWVRTTVYINFYTDVMHVWQNGTKVVTATLNQTPNKMCQWHFGLYASGPNDNIVLYEEDISIVKLLEPLTNFAVEPWFEAASPCAIVP